MSSDDPKKARVEALVRAVRSAVLSAAGPQSDGRVRRPETLALGEALKVYESDANSCRSHDDCG